MFKYVQQGNPAGTAWRVYQREGKKWSTIAKMQREQAVCGLGCTCSAAHKCRAERRPQLTVPLCAERPTSEEIEIAFYNAVGGWLPCFFFSVRRTAPACTCQGTNASPLHVCRRQLHCGQDHTIFEGPCQPGRQARMNGTMKQAGEAAGAASRRATCVESKGEA